MRWMSRGLGMLGPALLTTVAVAWCASSAPAREALYVANANGPSLYQYAVQEDGSLLRAASVAKTAERPDALALSPDHRDLYVAQGNTEGVGSLLQYTIKPDGTLTPKQPAEVPTEREIEGIAVSPDGSSLYVIEGGFFGSGEVATYSIGPDGSLSATRAPRVSTGDQPNDIAVSHDGKSVYVSNWLEGTISQYTVQVDGSLAPMASSSVATGPQPYRLAIAPDGHSLYVTDEHFVAEPSEVSGGWVSQFTIGADGSLTPKTPAMVPAGLEPKGIAISPSGADLYVADSTETGHISQFSIGSDGTLAPLAPTAVSAGRQPFGLAVGLDGKHLYVSNSAEYKMGAYEIEAGGTLKAMEPTTVRAGEWPMSVVVVEVEDEPTIGEEAEEPEQPLERCYEPPPLPCNEPEPPGKCHEPEPPQGRCCGRESPPDICCGPESQLDGCCGPGPGEVVPLRTPEGCCPPIGDPVLPLCVEAGRGPNPEEPSNGEPTASRPEGGPGGNSRTGALGGGGESATPEALVPRPNDSNSGASRIPPLDDPKKASHHSSGTRCKVSRLHHSKTPSRRSSTTHCKISRHRHKGRKPSQRPLTPTV